MNKENIDLYSIINSRLRKRMSATKVQVFIFIYMTAKSSDSGRVIIEGKTIQEAVGCARCSVWRALFSLRELGLISTARISGLKSNTISINYPLLDAWIAETS